MTCLTAPRGRSTTGRPCALRFCAATGNNTVVTIVMTAAVIAKLDLIGKISLGQAGQTSGAVPNVVEMNVVQIEDAEQHVRVPLHVIGEDNVPVPFEFTVNSADKFDRYFFMRVPM